MPRTRIFLLGIAIGVAFSFFFVRSVKAPVSSLPDHVFSSSTSDESVTAVVTKVVDGDTIDVRFPDAATARVRIVGIDTPETVDPRKPVECGGPAASARLHVLLDDATVMLSAKPDEDTDDYGRILRYVSLNGDDIGALMLREGYAESLCVRYPHPKCEEYDALEAAARSKRIGRWESCAR